MLFRFERTSDLMNSYTMRRHEFPEEYRACLPDWIEGGLRTHYALGGELHEMYRKERPLVNPPPWDEPPAVVRALAEHDREMIDALACYIADQVSSELGAQVQVYGKYTKIVCGEVLDGDDGEYIVHEPRLATVVKQSGRTLTVEFDADEELPGLHEVDITDLRC